MPHPTGAAIPRKETEANFRRAVIISNIREDFFVANKDKKKEVKKKKQPKEKK